MPLQHSNGNGGSGQGQIIDLGRMPARVIQDALRDPAQDIRGAPPNLGRMVPPHIYTVQGRVGTIARVYRNADEAMRDNMQNARYMRNECGIMECLEARQRSTALLKWHLVPEDEKDAKQKQLCDDLTALLERIPRFVEMRRNLLEALWFGKYGIAYQWANRIIGGKMRKTIAHWEPRHGDKLVFRYDDGDGKYDPRQVGIRVGAGYTLDEHVKGNSPFTKEKRIKVEPTDQGLAYFLDKWERDNLFAIHKHIIEDGAWEDPIGAGAIHGVGIRSRIYASWFSMQELLGYLMEYVERAAMGVEIWPYEYGNSESESKTRKAAEEHMVGGRSIVLMPVYRGEDSQMFQIQHIEPGLGGVEALKSLIIEYFGHKIKRYILGQVLTSEAEATGLGSGVADAHMATFADIVRYDARNLEETLTSDAVEPLKRQNYPWAANVHVRFVIDTEADEMQEKLEAYEKAWNMGLKIKAEDVAAMIGASSPGDDDEVLTNPQIEQAAAMAAMGGVGFGGPGGQQGPPEAGAPPAGPGGGPEGGPEGGGEPPPLAPAPVKPREEEQEEEPKTYEAEKERVIVGDKGGWSPFSEIVDQKPLLKRYALGYQEQLNGTDGCFNCAWADLEGLQCSLYCQLNSRDSERYQMEEKLDGSAWCQLHTRGTKNFVRAEKYAAAAWEESKHPRDESGKFGSRGGGNKTENTHGQMTAEAQGLLAEVEDMSISKRDQEKVANLRGTLRRSDLKPEELKRVIFDLKAISRSYTGNLGPQYPARQSETHGTDTGYRKPPEASEEAKARAKTFAEEWQKAQEKKQAADMLVAKEVGRFEGWQNVKKQPKSKKGQLSLFHRGAAERGLVPIEREWAEHYARQMGMFDESEHPRNESGQFSSKGEGSPAATMSEEEFTLKNPAPWKKAEFTPEKKRQGQMWTGLDLSPGQRDFLEENPELAGETNPEEEEDIDPEAQLLAEAGRARRDGANVSFTRALGRGKPAESVRPSPGDIIQRKDGPWMLVNVGDAYFVSEDDIEDRGAWSRFPKGSGWYVQYEAIPVQPTAAQSAARTDEESTAARAKRRGEIEAIVQRPDNYRESPDMAGLNALWADVRTAGSERMYGDGRRLVYVISSYDDVPHTWEVVDETLSAEASTLGAESAKTKPLPEAPAELSGQKRLFEPVEKTGQKLLFRMPRSAAWQKYRFAWEESQHPRDEGGQFSTKEGGVGSGKRTVQAGGKQKTWVPGQAAQKSSDFGHWSQTGDKWIEDRPDTRLTAQPFGKYEPPTLGIPRAQMPQIAGPDKPAFLQQLKDKGIQFHMQAFAVSNLRGTQSDYTPEKVQAMAQKMKQTGIQPGSAVLASREGFILDGHHRWRGQREVDPQSKMNVLQVDLPIRQLLREAAAFPKVFYVGTEEGTGPRQYKLVCDTIDRCVERYRQSIESFKEDEHPRDKSGKFASGGGSAKAGDNKDKAEFRAVTLKGAAGEFKREVKKERGTWFYRPPGRADVGWTAASPGLSKQIEEQVPKPKSETGAQNPEDVPQSPPAKSESEAKQAQKPKSESKTGPAIVKFADLSANPSRFQYKVQDIDPETGVTREFSDVEFEPMLAGMLYVWRDPDDGKSYVINGHHRYEIGKRSGYGGDLPVYYINAASGEEARAKGALINIAEGHGTALDAAKYMRDLGLTGPEGIAHLEKHHVSLKGKVASEALKLANLSDHAYRELAYGRLDADHAGAIGEVLSIPEGSSDDRKHAIWEAQNKVVSAIQGRSGYVPTKVAREMAVVASLAPSVARQGNLFGDDGGEELLINERGDVQAAVRESLLKEIRGLGAVSARGREELLREKGVGEVSGEKAAEEKQRIQNLQQVFDREIRYRGGVGAELNKVLNDAAKEYKSARNRQERNRIKGWATEKSRSILEAAESAERRAGAAEMVGGGATSFGGITGFSQPTSSPGQVAMFSRAEQLDQFREHYRRSWEAEKLRVAYRAIAQRERYRDVSGQVQATRPEDWSSWKGPKGGKGWRNGRTGEVVYQDERPGTEGKPQEESEQRPQQQQQTMPAGAAQVSDQGEQLPLHGPYKVNPKDLEKADQSTAFIPKTGEQWQEWKKAVEEHPYRKEAVRRLDAYSVVSKFDKDKDGRPKQGSTYWSENKYRRPDGTYEPERAAIHEEILSQIINPAAATKPGETPQAFVLMGPPAAGKTSAGQPMAERIGLRLPNKKTGDRGNVTIINPDDIKEMLPEYEGWNAGIVHEESAWLAEHALTERALAEKHHVVFDLTGKNAGKMKDIVDRLETLDYEITVANVQVNSKTAGWRAWKRFRDNAFGNQEGPDKEPGRYVPPDYAAEVVDGKPEQTYAQLRNHPAVKRWQMINTDGFEHGRGPQLVEQGSK